MKEVLNIHYPSKLFQLPFLQQGEQESQSYYRVIAISQDYKDFVGQEGPQLSLLTACS
jgi:hypothetical protein